jgi:PAS domain S-box-containing protein
VNDLLNTAPCGFLSFAEDGTVTRANATLLEMLGYAREDLVGKHLERILTVGTRIFYQTHWFPLLRLHGQAEEIFLMLRSRTGDEIGVLSNAVRRENGAEVCYDCVLMRVRERQKYEDELLRARRTAEQALADLELTSEELRVANEDLVERTEEAERLRTAADEANRAKSEFLAVMSHELRTPLNAIAGYVQIMEMGIHGPITDEQRDDLARITRSQGHLLRLINDVLNLARIESGHVEYLLEDSAVAEIVALVLPMVEPQIRSKDLLLAVEIDSELVVRADREKVQQILLNLIGNAVKFTPGGGRIRVDAVPAPDSSGRLLLRVTDTGIGIAPDRLDSVFERFVQVDAGGIGAAQGSGLGLAISRELARGMGGDLTATSTPGEGSTFMLALPPG